MNCYREFHSTDLLQIRLLGQISYAFSRAPRDHERAFWGLRLILSQPRCFFRLKHDNFDFPSTSILDQHSMNSKDVVYVVLLAVMRGQDFIMSDEIAKLLRRHDLSDNADHDDRDRPDSGDDLDFHYWGNGWPSDRDGDNHGMCALDDCNTQCTCQRDNLHCDWEGHDNICDTNGTTTRCAVGMGLTNQCGIAPGSSIDPGNRQRWQQQPTQQQQHSSSSSSSGTALISERRNRPPWSLHPVWHFPPHPRKGLAGSVPSLPGLRGFDLAGGELCGTTNRCDLEPCWNPLAESYSRGCGEVNKAPPQPPLLGLPDVQ